MKKTNNTSYNDRVIFELIDQEQDRQKRGLELIASENYVSDQVLAASGSILTNKYAEGLPKKRYYGGCEIVDQIEQLAIDRVCKLFGAQWANVQPHSGTQANIAVMMALLKPGDTILGFDLSHGGHLTHGSHVNFSGKFYRAEFYRINAESGRIDMNNVAEIAEKSSPKLIICGASAYSRDWDYAKFREIADRVGAILMADIAHPAGLIACGLLNNPFPYCHIVTTTTHKTLRGPRGGVIMIGEDIENPAIWSTPKKPIPLSMLLDKSVFPGAQGGPLEHIIAAKAIAFQEALEDSYFDYALQIQRNAHSMSKAFVDRGYTVVSGGTDNHLLMLDLRNKNLTGKFAEQVLVKADITVNKNMVPFDTQSPLITSGIRLGTPAITTRGLKESDMEHIVDLIDIVITHHGDDKKIGKVKEEVNDWMNSVPCFVSSTVSST